MRTCLLCAGNLTNTHGNRRRHPSCKKEADKARFEATGQLRQQARDIGGKAVVAYMEKHCPQSLALIRVKIMQERAVA